MPITHNFTVITKECQRFRYPPDFTAASNKTIKVLNADLVIIDSDSIIRPRGLTLHSDCVQNELMVIGEVNRENSPFSSSFVCCINDTISVPRVFPQYNQAMEFKIWIVDANNEEFRLTADMKLVLEMIIEYEPVAHASITELRKTLPH